MNNFTKNDEVILIQNNNPWRGCIGLFQRYGKGKSAGKLFVKLLDGKTKWFYENEVKHLEKET